MAPFTESATWEVNKKALEALPHKQIALFACDVARLALPMFEEKSRDKRPRTAIDVAVLYVYGKTTKSHVLDAAAWAAKSAELVKGEAVWAACAAINAANAASNVTAGDAAWAATNALVAAGEAASAATNALNAAGEAAMAALNAANAANVAIISKAARKAYVSSIKVKDAIKSIYHQTKQITIPTTPILQAIANQIRITRNFQEYNILLDNLEEVHGISLPREMPLGLSHYVLFSLTNTH